jgi:co-chaperonin GroES (HSP10)
MQTQVKFKPLQDYVLIKPETRSRSEKLIVITSETDQGSWGAFGTVIASGPGKRTKKGKTIPTGLNTGDRVLYGGQGLGCIKFPKYVQDGQEYLVIQGADVCFIDERIKDASHQEIH